MTDRRRLPFISCAAVLAVAALLLGACGGGVSKDEYEAGLAKVQAQMQEATKASNGAAGVTDAAERRAALDTAHAALERAAKTAAGIEAPDDVAKPHRQMAKAVADYADLFERLAKLPEDDPSAVELYGEAGGIVKRLESANAAIEKAGYSVPQPKD